MTGKHGDGSPKDHLPGTPQGQGDHRKDDDEDEDRT